MAHGASKSGKYWNRTADADINRGCYGKFNAEQIEERIELHARRMIEGRPRVTEIATHWHDKYGIEMSYQSEKSWCNTKANKEKIEARAAELRETKALAKPTLDAQTLINSLAKTAANNAENCGELKKRMNSAINADCTPWGLLNITEKEYLGALGPRRAEYDSKFKTILTARKESLNMAIAYCKAYATMSKEFRESVKQTYEIGKYHGIIKAQERQKTLNEVANAEIRDATEEEKQRGNELTEAEIEAAREELYGEDN